MIKFVKKEHVKKDRSTNRIVITYSATEIFLGFVLLGMVIFYIYYYLANNLYTNRVSAYGNYTTGILHSSPALPVIKK